MIVLVRGQLSAEHHTQTEAERLAILVTQECPDTQVEEVAAQERVVLQVLPAHQDSKAQTERAEYRDTVVLPGLLERRETLGLVAHQDFQV